MIENENSFWFFLINKRPIALIITISIILFGSFSAITLPKELQPEINIPFATIQTALPGATPLDIESLISIPLEKEISNLSNIKTLSSRSAFGFSIIFIEFENNTDINQAVLDLKDSIDKIKNTLPEDATSPIVNKADANSISIISFSITGDRPLSEITDIAEIMQNELKSISGISDVDILGAEKKSIYINIDKEKSKNLNIDLSQVSNIIKSSNINFPIGVIQTDNTNYSVRLDNQIRSIQEIENLSIKQIDNTIIKIKDIAEIEESFPEKNSLSMFSTKNIKSKEAITLVVYKKTGGNIIKIAEDSLKKLNELKDKNIVPKDIQISISNDNSKFIKKDLGVLIQNGLLTALIITLILFLALGFREGLLAGLSIPLSFLITFSVMKSMNLSINSLSLFSLVIALGIMVDTAVVIMDGIHKRIEDGKDTLNACKDSVNTYKWALIAGTSTTIFAFFPMLLVSGIIGEFLKTLPIVISTALLSSLFVSLTLIPSISTKYLKKRKKVNLLKPLFEIFSKYFEKIVSKNLISKKRKIITIISSLILFVLSMSLPISGAIQMELFPKTDVQYFYINIETPKGTTIEESKKVAEKIEEYLYTIEEIENFLTIVGQSSSSLSIGSNGPSQDSNLANITINLVDEKYRNKKSFEIAEEIRQKYKNFRQAKITVQEISEGPPGDSAINLKVRGEDYKIMGEITDHIKDLLSKIPETQNIIDNREEGLNEFVFTLDREKIALYGLNPLQISLIIRNAVLGITSEEIKINGEDYRIFIKYKHKLNENNKTTINLNDLNNLVIQSPYGYLLQINEFTNYSLQSSISSINRENQKREIKISSDVSPKGNAVQISKELEEKLKDYPLPSSYEISFGGDLEQINESFEQLYFSMLIGIILIAFTLVLEFNSFRQAFIVLLSLPLGIIGVFPGLFFLGLNFSFPAFLGIVALSGIVVNNAIVLLDSINQNIKEKKLSITNSISDTVSTRVRPIILTTITTIVGILPLAISDPFWAGLGFTLVFGLLASSITTLIVVPTIFFMFQGKH